MEGGTPELSEQLGLVHGTLYSMTVRLSNTMSAGQFEQEGGSVSATVTKNKHWTEFPALSVTLYSTVLDPIPNSFGRSVFTYWPLIFKVIVKESFVIPGSLSTNELSLKEKAQVTVATFVPGSLFCRMVADGHVNKGGSKSLQVGETALYSQVPLTKHLLVSRLVTVEAYEI